MRPVNSTATLRGNSARSERAALPNSRNSACGWYDDGTYDGAPQQWPVSMSTKSSSPVSAMWNTISRSSMLS